MQNVSPQTRSGLLSRLRDSADQEAWSEFVDLYGPVIDRWCRRRGLQEADAADVMQTVLIDVARAIRGFRYDRRKGYFRGWLATFVRRHVSALSTQGRRRRLSLCSSEGLDARQHAPEDADAAWDEDLARQRFRRAAGRARADFHDRTWRAFWRTAVDGAPAEALADELGMTVGAVYVARCRVLKRITDLARHPVA
ncbi:MAG: sigma-70 family RNA polymerase sigma factor [Planctomycetota bacterium]